MANDYYISAGIIPIDNSSGATAMSYYISAGIPPTDTAAGGNAPTGTFFGCLFGPLAGVIGMFLIMSLLLGGVAW